MKEKGFGSVFIILAVLLVLMAGTVYYFGFKQNVAKVEQSTPITTLKPTNTPAVVNVNKKNLYKDNYLKVQFNYPDGLSLNFLEAEVRDPRSIIYIAKNPTEERQKTIDYVVKCNRNNRIDPAGVCVEGIVADLDIYIFEESFSPASYKNEESNKKCQKSQIESKTIYSCTTSGPDGKETYRYSVYLGKPRIKMMIDTKDRNSNQEIIKTIIESFSIQ